MNKEQCIADVLNRRLDACLAQAPSLKHDDDEAVHAFRLACKRLRFAIERFEISSLVQAAKTLARLTDALGAAHDCTVLAKRARKLDAFTVAQRALKDRDGHVRQGRDLWHEIAPTLAARIP